MTIGKSLVSKDGGGLSEGGFNPGSFTTQG